ncbi:MAG: D-sedoheptulose 7-phosphate isomerase, partial [Blastocatellia bacterium]|nr:D-sedoheptulose 7-phosphate isomerase [Blastocatellia bacterium]
MSDIETIHPQMINRIGELAAASIDAKRRFFDAHPDAVARAALMLIEALRSGRKILLFGNGGSAADAQHIAAEFVNRYQMERPGLPAIALTTDTSILTSIGNDTTFEEIFSRQIEAFGQAGDVAVAITTSGRSPNVVRGVQAARQRGLHTIGLLGKDGGVVKDLVDLAIIVPSDSTS